jgi:hypothetical protein
VTIRSKNVPPTAERNSFQETHEREMKFKYPRPLSQGHFAPAPQRMTVHRSSGIEKPVVPRLQQMQNPLN